MTRPDGAAPVCARVSASVRLAAVRSVVVRRATIRPGALRSVGVGAVLLLGLTGCAGPTDLSDVAAERLQAAVVDVAHAASQQQYDAAAAALVELRAALEAAAGAGEISAARYRSVDRAIVVTEAELAAARQVQQAVVPEPEQPPIEPLPAEPAVAEPAVADPAVAEPAAATGGAVDPPVDASSGQEGGTSSDKPGQGGGKPPENPGQGKGSG